MIEPTYVDGCVTLYRGDALAMLAGLPDASVDALITDPPYSSGGFTRADRTATTRTKYVDSDAQHDLVDFSGDNRDQRGYGYWCALWLSECLRIVKPGGVALLFTDWRQLPVTTDALQAGGWIWRGIVPWAKTSYRPQSGRFAAQCEYVIWGSSGVMGIDFKAECFPGFFSAAAPREREHITQKPISVMRELVRIAPEGGVVLDPFMGSGTTGAAAALEGRRFIGAEVSPVHYRTAFDRISGAHGEFRPRGLQDPLGFELPA